MRYYPVFLDLKDKKCCVVGGGNVAERKVKSLLKSGARIWVISPFLTKGLLSLCRRHKITHLKSLYRKKFIKNSFLVIAATDDSIINAEVSQDARKGNILVNLVDEPAESNFIVPSVIKKEGLVIAISTSGQAPGLAKRIRIDLTKRFIPRYARALKLLGRARQKLKSSCLKIARRRSILAKMADSALRKRCKTES
jgi:precorrin-2 dehydrogenase/sirohydrochlorin ferrochelatase